MWLYLLECGWGCSTTNKHFLKTFRKSFLISHFFNKNIKTNITNFSFQINYQLGKQINRTKFILNTYKFSSISTPRITPLTKRLCSLELNISFFLFYSLKIMSGWVLEIDFWIVIFCLIWMQTFWLIFFTVLENFFSWAFY